MFNEAGAEAGVRNVVLVHGAFADGSSWARVIPLLRARGLEVTAVQLPLTSLAEDVAAVRRAIARQDGPVLLVGHSWGGMVVSEAGNAPRVAGLVYVSAFVPQDGQNALDVLAAYPPAPGIAEEVADAAGFLSITRRGIYENFVPDILEAERELVYVTQGPLNTASLGERVPSPAWKSRPTWYVAVDDRMLPPEYEQEIARRINATTITLAASHVPMLSRPAGSRPPSSTRLPMWVPAPARRSRAAERSPRPSAAVPDPRGMHAAKA